MEALEKIIEFDENGCAVIRLNKEFSGKQAKIILLFEDEQIPEKTWVKALSKDAVFDFLKDESEDIYTLNDGEPYKP